ncbi:integrase catalytic domain-containing protein [Trichonephila clavipes]|nr:integrase catalytic domain-containing protein [Trichonephila clavipes]
MMFSTLDTETASHISVRQADKWFDPLTLGKEIDLFYSSRGKPLSESIKYCRKNENSKNMSRVFFSDVKGKKCVLCQSDSHFLNKCPQYKQLSVNKRVELVKNNSLCFNCLNLHRVKFCKSKVLCKCCQKLLCVSLETQILRVKGSFNLLHWGQKEPETEESSMSQLSAKASLFKPINYIGEISKEVSSQGVGDLFNATSYVKSKSVLLSTAICFIRDSFGKMQEKSEHYWTVVQQAILFRNSNTVFGYIASGSIPVSSENKPHCGLIKDNVDLEKTMRRFWEIENVEPETIKNKETIICEEHFQKNHARDSTGRYIVSMPFKKDPNCLGQSKDIALTKLNSLWNRLKREPNYLKLYRDFLKEYKELGHMQEVDEREERGMYFIPHLGVYRSDKRQVN